MRLKAGSSLDYVSADGTFSWRATMEGATGTDGATLANATLSAEWTF